MLTDLFDDEIWFRQFPGFSDSWANKEEVKEEYGIDILNDIPVKKYDVIVLAVSHKEFAEIDFVKIKKEKSVVFDVKAFLNREIVDARL